jgi:hypothetical protein
VHETDASVAVPSIGVSLHVAGVELALALATTWPPAPTATQRPLPVQATESSATGLLDEPIDEATVPQELALVGFALTRTLPLASTLTQNVLDTHDTPLSVCPESIVPIEVHDTAGLRLYSAPPAESTAMQNAVEGHETLVRACVSAGVVGVVQLAPPVVLTTM